MKLKSIALNMLSIVLLISLSGCARYRAKSLKSITKSSTKAEAVSFSYRIFSPADCQKYLGRNVIRKGYQPIQITFVNNTDRYFNISKRGLSFDYASTKEVLRVLHFNTTGRAVGYGILGLFLWPFIIPAIVDGIGSAKANKQMDADFADKILTKQIVEPHTTVNGIVFVDADSEFDEDFTFTVSDINHNQYTLSTTNPEATV